jgi:hypothetical protein
MKLPSIFIDRFGNLSNEGYIYGDASFVLRGTVEVLENGNLKADLELRPYTMTKETEPKP